MNLLVFKHFSFKNAIVITSILSLIIISTLATVGIYLFIRALFNNDNKNHPKPIYDGVDKYRQEYIKKMMAFAWQGYAQYAWDNNELAPNSMDSSGGPFDAPMGATIVDAADTLWMMGMHAEFARARAWIAAKFDIGKIEVPLSVFETNIRFLGGLLSAFALTKDKMFLDKARQVGDVLLPAFDTNTGIPRNMVKPSTRTATNSGPCCSLAGLGTLELELAYLSRLTNDSRYGDRAAKARQAVTKIPREHGLYYNLVDPNNASWCSYHVSLGGRSDSFYEYLLKIWIFNGSNPNDEIKKQFELAIEALEKYLLFKSTPSKLWYFAEMSDSKIWHQMEHLACFSAGMFALKTMHEDNFTTRAFYTELAEQIGHTCHESYIRRVSGIGPEIFEFSESAEVRPAGWFVSYYHLRPEAIEGWFYLWRLTHNPKYRDWCWEAALAIERYCRATAGYSGLYHVNWPWFQDNVQQSFFLAETLKYLFLTFGSDDDYELDQWVFNTEAHPFPISSN